MDGIVGELSCSEVAHSVFIIEAGMVARESAAQVSCLRGHGFCPHKPPRPANERPLERLARRMLVTKFLLVTNVTLLTGLAVLGYRNRDNPGAGVFAALQAVSAIWAGLTIVGLSMPSGPTRLRVWGITTGMSLLAVALWLGFILSYTGRGRWLAPRRFGAVVAPLVVGALVYFVYPAWSLLASRLEQATTPVGTVVEAAVGPVGVLLAVYIYSVFLAGIVLVLKTVLERNTLFAGQAIALVGGTLVTVLASVGSIAGIPTEGYPLTQVALGGQSLFWGYAVFRHRFLDLIPGVAHIGERAVFDELDDGVLVVNRSGTILRANPQANAYLDTERLAGESIDATFEAVGLSELPGRFTHSGRTYQAKRSTVRNWQDMAIGQAIVIRDVSDLVGRRQRLEVLNRILRHDIRNGMNVVLGRAAQLDPSDPDAKQAVEVIERNATEIVELSRKARRFDAVIGDERVAETTVDIVPMIRRICDSLRMEYPAAEIRTTLPERACIVGNELTEVAISNVVENALKHNDASDPYVEVSISSTADDGTVAVRVTDNGPGLPSLERKVVTQRSETPLEHSRGLGLWLTTWAVEETGGDIAIADNDPRGTVITLRFSDAPSAVAQQPTPDRGERPTPSSSGTHR
ncbi:MAG: histidine kinase N-terminal 7TM domain-containing protein [Haloglomus sp.]